VGAEHVRFPHQKAPVLVAGSTAHGQSQRTDATKQLRELVRLQPQKGNIAERAEALR
jgi:hypothetical protein